MPALLISSAGPIPESNNSCGELIVPPERIVSPSAHDQTGTRQDFEAIPESIDALKDDPYRSLAGELRRAGGFAKDITPFSEFLWADFLRDRVKPKAVAKDFENALAKALALAKTKDASYLPGWCGPNPIS